MPAPGYEVEIAALETGLSSGEATVESDGDRVTYRGVTEILAAISYFRSKATEAVTGIAPRRGSTLAIFDRNC
jgi:hypothetical protein